MRTSPTSLPFRPRPDVIAAVACGGMVGATARWWVAEALSGVSGDATLPTLVENLVGSFLLGLALTTVAVRTSHRLLTPFLTTGILGAFTTMSAFHLDTVRLFLDAGPGTALAYAAGGLAGGVACAGAGLALGHALTRRRGHDR